MSGKIDYEKYLAGLGEVETNQKLIIKKYLEEQCEKDEALKSLYRPEKLDECYCFIVDVVAKMKRDGRCSCVEESIVYKMARDFYIEILPTIAENPPEVSAATKKKESKKEKPKEEPAVDISKADISDVSGEMTKDAAEDKVVRDKYGFEIYGETEEPEEQEETPCHQDILEDKNEQKDDLLNSLLYEPGQIIDKAGEKLAKDELFKGLHFVFADYKEAFDYLIVMEIRNVTQTSVSYSDGKNTLYYFFNEKNPASFVRNMYRIPQDACIIGEYDFKANRRDFFSEKRKPEAKEYDEDGNYLLFGF